MISICLSVEVKRQWATLLLGLMTASGTLLLSLMALWLMLVDRNPFWPCFTFGEKHICGSCVFFSDLYLFLLNFLGPEFHKNFLQYKHHQV